MVGHRTHEELVPDQVFELVASLLGIDPRRFDLKAKARSHLEADDVGADAVAVVALRLHDRCEVHVVVVRGRGLLSLRRHSSAMRCAGLQNVSIFRKISVFGRDAEEMCSDVDEEDLYSKMTTSSSPGARLARN